MSASLTSALVTFDLAEVLWRLVLKGLRDEGCHFWWFEVVCKEPTGPTGYKVRSPDPMLMSNLKFVNKQKVSDVFTLLAERYHFELEWYAL